MVAGEQVLIADRVRNHETILSNCLDHGKIIFLIIREESGGINQANPAKGDRLIL